MHKIIEMVLSIGASEKNRSRKGRKDPPRAQSRKKKSSLRSLRSLAIFA
jgi:hypothetical protein